MFELHQLEQLITVAECGTLSAAAEKLHLSQPALSRSMQKLEAELQVPLFTRHKNKIELNENAEMAVDYARKILWQSQDMIDHLRAFDLSRRTIRVGSCPFQSISCHDNFFRDEGGGKASSGSAGRHLSVYISSI